MDTFVVSVCPLDPDSSDFGDVHALYAPFLHQLTMQSSLFERGCPVLVVVYVARKLRPCPSYSRRRDRIDLGFWRSLYKGGAGYKGQKLRVKGQTWGRGCLSTPYLSPCVCTMNNRMLMAREAALCCRSDHRFWPLFWALVLVLTFCKWSVLWCISL